MSLALFGLGLGWCLSYVAATTELVDLAGAERARPAGRHHRPDLVASAGPRSPSAAASSTPARAARSRSPPAPAAWRSSRPPGWPETGSVGRARRERTAPDAATIPARRAPVRPFLRMKTYNAKPGEIQRDWFSSTPRGRPLGRLATQIADRLRGKSKPVFTPHVDTGDFVVVVNAEKITVTGKKLDQKMYYRHSGYPGGLRERTLREQLDRQPTEVLRKAVKGMLPRNKLGRAQLTKLKIYAGPEHPHEAQAPTTLEV